MSNIMNCSLCGALVKIVSTGEGTNYYEPVDADTTEAPKGKALKFRQTLDKMWDIFKRKDHDYAGKQEPLNNFFRCLNFGLSPYLAVLGRMADKWSRIENITLDGGITAVDDEKVEDTLLDLANYAIIAYIIYKERGMK
jgi:hypothetical protein